MLQKLQRKTLIPAQIIGYAITLLVGVAIVVLVFQLYADIKPLLTQQTNVFKSHAVTVSKPVTLFKTLDKSKLGISKKEMEELQHQEFVKKMTAFTSASFHVAASINLGPQGSLYTEMFFESVPDEFLDVTSERWGWNADSGFLPIIIPEDYLNLYNFGFAESQSLPVVSQSTIEQIPFDIHITGNGKHQDYKSSIVGFSNNINTILVPDDFLQWANQEYGKPEEQNVTRLLVEFTDASDERIPAYFESHGFVLNENELQSSKLMFFFKVALSFVFSVAAIIIILSMAFIVMSMNLIVQKNRDLFVNLYNIGYSPKKIARFYQVVISTITLIDIVLASLIAIIVREQYLNRLSSLFETVSGGYTAWITAGILALLLVVVYIILIKRIIKKCIINE